MAAIAPPIAKTITHVATLRPSALLFGALSFALHASATCGLPFDVGRASSRSSTTESAGRDVSSFGGLSELETTTLGSSFCTGPRAGSLCDAADARDEGGGGGGTEAAFATIFGGSGGATGATGGTTG